MLQSFTTANHSAADQMVFLDFVKRVRTVFGGGGGGVYSKFLDFLELYQFGEITGLDVYVEVVKLFQEHEDLVALFKSLVSVRQKRKIDDRDDDAVKKANRAEQTKTEETECNVDVKNRGVVPRRSSLKNLQTFAPANDSVDDMEVFVDFLKRVRTRFGDNGVYGKFLGYMESYQFGEISSSDVYVEVVKLFGKHKDLVALFKSLVPGKIDDRSCNPRKRERIMSKEEKIDFSMEDSLFEVDVKISNLESTYENAMIFSKYLSRGNFSALDVVCFNENFTTLNLAFIRKLSRRKELLDDGDPAAAVSEVIRLLNKKREALRKSRDNIIKRWNKSRQSR